MGGAKSRPSTNLELGLKKQKTEACQAFVYQVLENRPSSPGAPNQLTWRIVVESRRIGVLFPDMATRIGETWGKAGE